MFSRLLRLAWRNIRRSPTFVGLVGIAIGIASPVAGWLMNTWLQGFAYHVAIGWWVFMLAGAAAVGMALITVSLQTVKAATANPVRHLQAQ